MAKFPVTETVNRMVIQPGIPSFAVGGSGAAAGANVVVRVGNDVVVATAVDVEFNGAVDGDVGLVVVLGRAGVVVRGAAAVVGAVVSGGAGGNTGGGGGGGAVSSVVCAVAEGQLGARIPSTDRPATALIRNLLSVRVRPRG